MPVRCPLFLAFLLAIVILIARTGTVCGQADNPDRTVEPTVPRPGNTVDDLRYLPAPNGRLVPVPDRAAYEDFLKFLRSREHLAPPEASTTRVRIEGGIDQDSADLQVKLEVQVSVDGVWVRIPLGLREAQLSGEITHAGGGEFSPGIFDPESGFDCWLIGKGRHELTLPLRVPLLSRQFPRRLVLGLPSSPLGTARLRLPGTRLSVKSGERTTVGVRQENGRTEVDLVGLEGRLELAWQPLPPQSTSAPVFEVTTHVAVTLVENESTTIEATQRIQTPAQQVGIEQFQVRLPEGTELLRLESPDVLTSDAVPDSPGVYQVRLRRPVTGGLELKYTLRAPPPQAGESFTLDGFDVQSASAHNGFVVVTVVGQLRSVRDLAAGQFVHRVNLSELPANLRAGQASLGYRFFRRLQLPLRFERVTPLASVEPVHRLLCRPGQLELVSEQRLQIRRGTLNRVMINWPAYLSDGWSVPTVEIPAGGDARVVESRTMEDRIEVELTDPVGGNVVLRLRSLREMADDETVLETALPVCEVQRLEPIRLSVQAATDLDVSLRGVGDRPLRPQSVGELEPLTEARGLTTRGDWLLDDAQSRVVLELQRQDRRISARQATVIRLRERLVRVEQTFALDVEFAPATGLSWRIPEALISADLEASIGDERLPTQIDRARRVLTVGLTPPRIGRFEILARYAVELPESGDAKWQETRSIPLLQLETAPVALTRVEIFDSTGLPLEVQGEEWTRRLNPRGFPVWEQEGASGSITLRWPDLNARRAIARIERAWLRSIVGVDGSLRTRAQYLVSAGVSALPCEFPVGWKLENAWWNSQRSGQRRLASTDSGASTWIITCPDEDPQGGGLVTLDLRGPPQDIPPRGLHLELPAPRLPPDQTPGTCFWQIWVPAEQYLATRVEGFAPAYEWTRSGLGWSRKPLYTDDNLRKWVGDIAGIPGFEPEPQSHAYLLQTTLGTEQFSARFVGRLLLVLSAVGPILMGGLLVRRWRKIRSLPLAAAAGAILALVAVWWTDLVLLWLQPALLGGGVLAFYLMIDRLSQRPSSEALPLGRLAPAHVSTGPAAQSPAPLPAPPLGATATAQDATLVRPGTVRPGSGVEPQYSGGRS
jgi:hypothetical protein